MSEATTRQALEDLQLLDAAAIRAQDPSALFTSRDGPTVPWSSPVDRDAAANLRELGFEVRLANVSERVQDLRRQIRYRGELLEAARGILDDVRKITGGDSRGAIAHILNRVDQEIGI